MNLIDLILLLIVLLAVWAGWSQGFILGFVDLIIWLGSLTAGFFAYKYCGVLLQKIFPALGAWKLPLAFFICIILARILLAAIFNRFLRTAPRTAHTSGLNHAFGIFPGLVKGMIYATIFAVLLLTVPLSDTISATARDSKIANNLAAKIEWLDDKLSPIFGEASKETVNKLTVEPESDETVYLHYTVKNARVREDLESKMLDLVNEERTKRGLCALKMDPQLTMVARAHSQDMFQRGYFSHYTPERTDPFDRMKAAGVHFLAAGENLALGQTLEICHTGLMNSPGHRANILNKSFGRVGIGILDGGIHGLMISQEFRN